MCLQNLFLKLASNYFASNFASNPGKVCGTVLTHLISILKWSMIETNLPKMMITKLDQDGKEQESRKL
ncbi:hypothetical protein F511_03069 [Dorcoceras hygrometricum]|nr:hypothetical protein F511_03069 [Dorcoceras hygrometricum]